MSVMTMMEPLLDGVALTPGQLAELRAIDAFYYTNRATHHSSESGTPGAWDSELDAKVLARVRDMLHESQRALFDRNRDARRSGEARDSDRIERHR